MSYEYKEGNGMLFFNSFKEKPSQPDRTGRIRLGGKLYRISGWIATDDEGNPKLDKDGKQMLSLKGQLDEGKPKPTTSKMQPRSMKDELDDGDSIPF
jgi:hypothetical protein